MSRSLKATALICVLCLLLVVPAYAAVYPYTLKDLLVIEETHDNGDVTATFSFDSYDPHMTIYSQGMVYFDGRLSDIFGVDCTGRDFMNFHAWPLGHKYNAGDPITYGVLDIRDFKEHSTMRVSVEGDLDYSYIFSSEAPGNAYLTPSATIYFHFYDENGKYIRSIHETSAQRITLPEQPDGVQSRGHAILFSMPYEIPILTNAAYVVPAIECTVTLPGGEAGVQIINLAFDISDFRLHSSYNMFKEDSETLKAIDDKLEELLQQPEQEKQEASSGGQDAADQLVSVIPDHSEGFMTAIQDLADAMSYDGTEAKLTFPSITIPEIPGVTKKYVLSKPYPVDFGFWIQKMPDKLLTLVQVLGTLALVVYSFKELYGAVSYALTLKGGNSDG